MFLEGHVTIILETVHHLRHCLNNTFWKVDQFLSLAVREGGLLLIQDHFCAVSCTKHMWISYKNYFTSTFNNRIIIWIINLTLPLLRARILGWIFIQHDDNLWHIVQFWHHAHIFHRSTPLLILPHLQTILPVAHNKTLINSTNKRIKTAHNSHQADHHNAVQSEVNEHGFHW